MLVINQRYAIYMQLPTDMVVHTNLAVYHRKFVFQLPRMGRCALGGGEMGNRISPGKFSDSYKMERRVWSHDVMTVFQKEERRMLGTLSVTRVKTTSW